MIAINSLETATGIDVGQGINVAHGKFEEKINYNKVLQSNLETIRSTWKKFLNSMNTVP